MKGLKGKAAICGVIMTQKQKSNIFFYLNRILLEILVTKKEQDQKIQHDSGHAC